MSQILWTPKSEQDLDKIREYVASHFTVDLAIDVVNDLIDTVESMLTANPLCGSLLESNPFFFKITHKGNTVYYCENPADKNLYIVYVQARRSKYQNERLIDSSGIS